MKKVGNGRWEIEKICQQWFDDPPQNRKMNVKERKIDFADKQ